MRPTELLMEEHRAIERMLGIVEAVCRRLEAGQDVPAGDLEEIIEFIQVFADRCHHGKEEDLLFAEMEKAGIPRQGGPIGVMLVEHEQGRAHVRAVKEAVAAYKAGDRSVIPTIVRSALGYVSLLQQHIYKEDNILYRMADMHLSDEQERRLLEGFERVEQERIGPGRHEAFHALLDRLEQTYVQR